jgi:hypothetical protein
LNNLQTKQNKMENELNINDYDDEQKNDEECVISPPGIEDDDQCGGRESGVDHPSAHSDALMLDALILDALMIDI